MRRRASTRATLAALALLTGVCAGVTGCSSASVLSLETGECLATPSGTSVTDVDLRSCDSPHGLEVVGTFELDTPALPGEDELARTAQERCSTAFEDYVGIPVEQSRLDLTWLAPTSQSWNASGDRTVACLAGGDQDSLTASVKGSRR